MAAWQSIASRKGNCARRAAQGCSASRSPTIEFRVLAGVNHIKSGHPKHYAHRQKPPPATHPSAECSTTLPRMAIQAHTGAKLSAVLARSAPNDVNRLAKLYPNTKRQHR